MKIIIVGQYYWPENFLINDIAEDMVNRGHVVTVLTGLPDYATGSVRKEYRFFRNRHEFRNGVEIFRVPVISRKRGRIRRVFNYLSFLLFSSLFAVFHHIDADVIFAYQTAPVFMGNAGIVLKKKLKKPLFFYCLDIWPDQMKIWGIGEENPIYKTVLKYCRYAYGNGDLVGVSSLPFVEYMVNINKVNAEKIVYLPQHAKRIVYEEMPKESHREGIDFAFAGNIGEQQNVECILKAVSLLRTDKPFCVHIIGNGTSLEKCKQLAAELNIEDRVLFHGRVAKEELNKIYPMIDAFLLTLNSEKKMGYSANTVPAKLQWYMSSGKPIIASIDGGAKDIINSSGCGKAVQADDAEEFAKAMLDFIDHNDKYEHCGKNALKFFEANFEEKIIIDKLEGYLIQLTGKNEHV